MVGSVGGRSAWATGSRGAGKGGVWLPGAGRWAACSRSGRAPPLRCDRYLGS